MIMQPVEYALRIQLSVIWIADMKNVFPGDEDVIEHRQIVEFVTGRRQRMLDAILVHRAFTADDGDALGIDRRHGIDDLLCGYPGTEKHTDVDPVGKSGAGPDRLDAIDHDAL